jgi:hypothetical protein
MARRNTPMEPITFSAEEIGAARTGDYRLVERRLRQELSARGRALSPPKPHPPAQVKRLAKKARGK